MSQANQAGKLVWVATLAIAALVIGFGIWDHPCYGGLPGFGMGQILILGIGLALVACTLLPL